MLQTPRTGSPPFKRSSCSEARQAPPERQALLGKLFTSLELLHAAKAAAAAPIRRSPPLLGQGSSGAGHVVHQQPVGTALSKHDAQLGRPDRYVPARHEHAWAGLLRGHLEREEGNRGKEGGQAGLWWVAALAYHGREGGGQAAMQLLLAGFTPSSIL